MKKEAGSKLTQKIIFTYSTEHLVKKDKIRFYYALKGRDGKTGIVKYCKIEQLGRAVLLVQQKHAQEVEEFLKFWKCEFKKKSVWLEKSNKPTKTDKLIQKTILTYSIEHMQQKDKIRFYYALKGRDGKTGIVKYCKIEQLGRAVLLVQQKHAQEVEEFLKFWKCNYKMQKVLVE